MTEKIKSERKRLQMKWSKEGSESEITHYFRAGFLLHGVCLFSLCICRFSMPTSSHSLEESSTVFVNLLHLDKVDMVPTRRTSVFLEFSIRRF